MSRKEDSFTWSLNAQWDATADTMVYASAATGFKAGGFNSFYMGLPQGLGADSNDVAFDEEEVLSLTRRCSTEPARREWTRRAA